MIASPNHDGASLMDGFPRCPPSDEPDDRDERIEALEEWATAVEAWMREVLLPRLERP